MYHKFLLKHPKWNRNKYYIGNTIVFAFTHQLLLFPMGVLFFKRLVEDVFFSLIFCIAYFPVLAVYYFPSNIRFSSSSSHFYFF